MERIYVRARYLKIAHYMFYSLAVFSITSAFALWSSFTEQSVGMIIFSVIYLNASIWLAYFFYKDYKIQLEKVIVVTRYARPYIILSISVFAMTELLLYLIPEMGGLIYSMMFINFYYAFIIIIGGFLYLIKPIRRLFEFQSARALRKGMEIASKYSHFSDVLNYQIGTSPFIDEVLEDIFNNKDFPVPHIQRLEIEVFQSKISDIESRLELAKKWKWSPKIVSHLVNQKDRYLKRIEDIEKYSN
jgi:hypothetical protein